MSFIVFVLSTDFDYLALHIALNPIPASVELELLVINSRLACTITTVREELLQRGNVRIR